MLKMTWARFRGIQANLEIAQALDRGKGLTHEQIIEIQKKSKDEETERRKPTFG